MTQRESVKFGQCQREKENKGDVPLLYFLSVSLTEIGMTFGGVPVFRWNFVFFTKKTQNLLCQCPKLT